MKKKYRSKIVITHLITVSGQEHKVADRDDDSCCTLIVTGSKDYFLNYIQDK